MNRTLLALLLASGCIKGATEDQTEAPPPEPQSEAVYAAQPDESENDAVLASLSEEAAAYYANCSHVFKVPQDESDEMVEECAYQSFDQNCAPDPSGCWDDGQSCISGCNGSCKSCDGECGGDCDGCKTKCKKGDHACVAACAEARVGCRDKCMADKEKCSDTDCPDSEKQCYDEHEALVAKTCPKCEQIEACFSKVLEMDGDKDPLAICGKKFKREPDDCIEWCGELF